MGRVFKELDVDRSQIVVSTKMCVYALVLTLRSVVGYIDSSAALA